MQNSRNMRIRTCIASPDYIRSFNNFLTPRGHRTRFDFEISTLNPINSDPFIKLKPGASEKLHPVMLKNNKKCITKSTMPPVSLKFSGIQVNGYMETKSKPENPSIKLEKKESFPSLRRQFSNLTKISQSKSDHKTKLQVFNKKTKKVYFSDKPLDVSFGDSG